MRIVLLLFMISVFYSCERFEEVDLELPYEEKAVAACFLNAEEATLTVWLQKTYPVIGVEMPTEPIWIADAQVLLESGSATIPFTYDSNGRFYTADVSSTPLEVGKTYKLSITTADGKVINGSTTIPNPISTIQTLQFDSLLSYKGSTYSAKFSITNTSNQGSYLLAFPYLVFADSSRFPFYFNERDRVVYLEPNKQITQVYTCPIFGQEPVRMELLLYTTDKPYAQYYNKNATIDYASLGIPFAEASVTYSNMSNGIGIIGSYTFSGTQSFPLK